MLLLAAVLALRGTPAHAQQEPAVTAGSVALPGVGAVRLAGADERPGLERSAAWRTFTARHGAWSALWNTRTGTPHRAFGPAIPLAGYADRADAVEAALRAFIAADPALFGTPTLETARVQRLRGTWYVSFRQTVRGMPVLFSDWEFRVGANGRLFAFGADAHRVAPGAVAAGPSLPAAVAREAARAGLLFDAARDRLEGGGTLALLPVATEDGLAYRTVAEVRVVSEDPPADWLTLVDAATGEVLWRQNRVRYAIGGLVTGTIHPLLPTDPLVARPFPHLTVNIGASPVATDTGGNYSGAGAGTVTVSAQLLGAYCNVNRQDGGPDASFSTSATDPATVDIAWTSANSHDAERDGYHHLNFVHDYVKTLDPGLTNIDYVAPCNVNINNTCNAFYSFGDGSVNFYLAGGGCPNTATMPDVVYHEYGHGVNEHVYYLAGQPSGMNNGALHEGMADVLACFIQDDPNVGKGFFGPGTILRTIDNFKHWPQDANSDPHLAGLIIGGAFWDLRQAVGLTVAARLSHFAKYGTPDDPDDGVAMNEFFVETMVADDDDADLTNGTPHLAEIFAAFNAHGIGTAQFMKITHTPLADQPGAGPYAVDARVQYTGPLGGLAGAPILYYAYSGGVYHTVSMTPAGPPDQFSALIPGLPGAVVHYFLSATDTYGQPTTDPASAPTSGVHSFLAGPVSTLLFHDMESEQGWVAGAVGDNATAGIWIRADPVGTEVTPGIPVQPEDDHTPSPGILCWVTGNALPGQGAGTNDVDGGKTTLTSPVFDATAGGLLHPAISYYRWYTNDQGESPSIDFWRADISNDGGTNWVSVESTTQSANHWQRILFRVADYLTPTNQMRMRFIAEDAGAGSLVEAGMDDFQLLAFSPAVLAVDGLPTAGGLALAFASSNPASGAMRLSYTLPAAGAVSLRVYDLRGGAVRTLFSGAQEAGGHTVEWDGRDDRQAPLPSGTYFARLAAGGSAVTRTLVRTR
jgi:hypothetical protein